MRKLDLKNYIVNGRNAEGIQVKVPFDVREALVDLCFIPAEGCKPLELLKRNKLAKKIAAAEKVLVLEEAEWQRLTDALEATRGLGRVEVELVERITQAPELPLPKG